MDKTEEEIILVCRKSSKTGEWLVRHVDGDMSAIRNELYGTDIICTIEKVIGKRNANEEHGYVNANEEHGPTIDNHSPSVDYACSLMFFDGGCIGSNPGPGVAGYTICKYPDTVYKHAEVIDGKSEVTNNYAEYTALVNGMKRALELGIKNIKIFGDSELVIKQVKSIYRIKAKNLKSLHKEAVSLYDKFSAKSIQHLHREKNETTDDICNEAKTSTVVDKETQCDIIKKYGEFYKGQM